MTSHEYVIVEQCNFAQYIDNIKKIHIIKDVFYIAIKRYPGELRWSAFLISEIDWYHLNTIGSVCTLIINIGENIGPLYYDNYPNINFVSRQLKPDHPISNVLYSEDRETLYHSNGSR